MWLNNTTCDCTRTYWLWSNNIDRLLCLKAHCQLICFPKFNINIKEYILSRVNLYINTTNIFDSESMCVMKNELYSPNFLLIQQIKRFRKTVTHSFSVISINLPCTRKYGIAGSGSTLWPLWPGWPQQAYLPVPRYTYIDRPNYARLFFRDNFSSVIWMDSFRNSGCNTV